MGSRADGGRWLHRVLALLLFTLLGGTAVHGASSDRQPQGPVASGAASVCAGAVSGGTARGSGRERATDGADREAASAGITTSPEHDPPQADAGDPGIGPEPTAPRVVAARPEAPPDPRAVAPCGRSPPGHAVSA